MPSQPMAERAPMEPRDRDEELAEALEALANPVRLTILRALREPRALKEVRVASATEHDQGSSDRPISRQAVKHHLERLEAIDAVKTRSGERSWGSTTEYLLDQRNLYVLGERFRSLAGLRPKETPSTETMEAATRENPYELEGPCLVLIKGVDEGRVFDLDPTAASAWTIGRRSDLPVALDYDPFVSAENTEIRAEGDGFTVRDLERSRNGTELNFSPLPGGRPQPLSHGDVIGVGRSLLLFRE